MKLPDWRSIHWKIALPQLGLILAVLIGLLLFLSDFLRNSYMDTLKGRLTAECTLLAAEVDSRRAGGASASSLDEFAHAAAADLGLRVTIIDSDGTVLGDSEADVATMENHLARPEVQQARSRGTSSSIRRSATTGINTLYVAVLVRSNGNPDGFVRLGIPLSDVDAAVRHLESTLIQAMVIAGAVSLALSFLAARRATRPLEDLTEAACRVAEGNLQTTLLPAGHDEIGRMTDAFNAMTRRLRSQFESLQTESGKLSAVLTQMTDGLIILDGQGMVSLINPAAERIFGVSRDRAVGHSATEVFRQIQLIDLWRQSREAGNSNSIAVEAGAEKQFLQTVATPLGGMLQGSTLMIFQDLSRLRRLETIRRDFIANISHELRTPLASLQSLAETLHDGAAEDRTAANRFLDLMQTEILELSRIESGEAPLELHPADPADICLDAERRIRMLAERNGLALENACPNGLPWVAVDSSRIGQVMMNLLHNAVKFTPAGGTVILSARVRDAEVEFSIKDNGVGVPADDLPRIFERFYKTDRSRASEGTGLGLSIARHIVEGHGGRIWAESTEGKGSTFYFIIPISKSTEKT
jgi:two-component system phosphate regulon sensor histidine kinase PhoR